MKKVTIILSIVLSHLGFAQVTDTGDKVGIGTATPGAKLDIYSNISIDHWINRMNTNTTNWSGFWGTSDNIRLLLRDNSGNIDIDLRPNGYSYINGGNVGIGTTSPLEKLHINGLIRIEKATNEDNNSPGIVAQSNDDFLYDGQYINNYGFGFQGYQDGSTTFTEPMNTYMSGYFGVDFFTSGQNRMRISHDGIVSIGTVNRQVGYKLAVNGNIKAKEIKVETDWSDFVFNKNYNLPTLKEVERHIKEKGHLKDIPSAKEVAESGILLGDMNAKLLQKIEELTLYTIQQEKKLQEQSQKNTELESRIEKMETLLQNFKTN